MSKFKPGLGRGLDALLNPNILNNDKEVEVSEPIENIEYNNNGDSHEVLKKIPINSIVPNPYQPRTEFIPEALEELKQSILQNGLIQPITVRRSPDDSGYQLISGERRLRASKEIGKREIPAYIIKVDTKEAMVAMALIENIQREELNAIEVAKAYKQLLEECNLSHEEIAEKVGKDRTTITNSLRLLKLPVELQDALIEGKISAGHARALINLADKPSQVAVLNKIIKEQLSVRKVEKLVKSLSAGNGKSTKEKTPEEEFMSARDVISNNDFESKLRGILGTKVMCKQKKDGSGNITIEFYSNDELERLFELFEIISENYS